MYDPIILFANLIATLAFVPYVIDVLNKKVVPSQVMWLILATVNTLTVLNSIFVGIPIEEIGIPLVFAVCNTFLFLLSLKYGEWGDPKEMTIVVVCAFISLMLWATSGPKMSLIALTICYISSTYPVAKTLLKNPSAEPLIPWLGWLVSIVLQMIAMGPVQEWEFYNALIPCAFLFLNLIISGLCIRRYV